MVKKNFIERIWMSDLAKLSEETASRTGKSREDHKIWPSEAMADVGPFAIGECKRALFYKLIGATPTDPQTIRSRSICDAGLMYEKYHIDKYKELGLFDTEQVKIAFSPDTPNGIAFSGKLDLIIKENNVRKGIELKTVSNFKADEVFGHDKRALPATSNLIQAMLYKYYFKYTENGKAEKVDEVYLQYVNRGDNTTFFYKVDIDEEGYAILTSITQYGEVIETIRLQEVPSYDDFISGKALANTSEDSRLAELRFSIKDIFAKCDSVYTYVNNKVLPSTDYKIVYTMEDVEREYLCGRISKIKLNKAKKNGEMGGSMKCSFCQYKRKCLSDSNYELK